MRFNLLDRIVALESGETLRAIKCLTMAEEYLADHFPGFPVIPGVLMLEAMVEAGAWLIREEEDFAHSLVVLREARNIKYASFLEPGQTLTVSVEKLGETENETKLKATGTVDGQVTVTGRLVLKRYNLADENPSKASIDQDLIAESRSQFGLIYRPVPPEVKVV
jgi:3-hydroxyacyl-[acyl-carrier-protein] dehydratase